MAKALILITAATFFFYGLWFVFDPSGAMYFLIQENLQSSSGNIDLRATYGGMSIAAGLIVFMLGQNTQTIRLGLYSVFLLCFAMTFGRTVGIAIDGNPNNLMLIYLAIEIIVSALALFLILSRRN